MGKEYVSLFILIFLGITLSCLAVTAQKPETAYRKELPGQIMHDPLNPARMVYNRDRNRDGALDPFFLCGAGDPEGFLYRGPRNPDGTRRGDQMKLIRKMKKHGGNGIYCIAVRTHGGDAWKDHRDDPGTYPDEHHNPWMDQDPHKGLNMKILDQWDTWFSEMDRQGIAIYFFIYDDAINIGNKLGWPLDAAGNLHPGEKQFLETLVKRFMHHKHLIWCIMEEGQEAGANWIQHLSKIAEVIRAADDHHHIIASHQLGGNLFFHGNDPNIRQFALQTDKDSVTSVDDLYQWMTEAADHSDGLYSIVMSEDFVHGNFSVPNRNRDEFRQRCWASAMAGAYSLVLGIDIAGTPVAWLGDLRRIQNFFENTGFNRMTPAQHLLYGDTRYVLADPGFDYILYTKHEALQAGLKNVPGGRYSLTWFDCETGKQRTKKNLSISQGDQIWDKPGGLGRETVLYLHREDARPVIGPVISVPKMQDSEKEWDTVPVAFDEVIRAKQDVEITIQLRYNDADGGPGPYSVEIEAGPVNGSLTGEGNDKIYKPKAGFIGTDSFSWKVSDGKNVSNTGIVKITVY